MAVLFESSGPNDDVGDAGLIFKGREDNAGRRARPLTYKDETRNLDALAVAALLEIGTAENAATV
jgi:hypothetical protein